MLGYHNQTDAACLLLGLLIYQFLMANSGVTAFSFMYGQQVCLLLLVRYLLMQVDFVPVNDPPSMQITGTVDVTQYSSSRNRQANNTYEEDNLPVALIENLTIYDVDSNNGSWLKVVLNRALDGQAEKLAFNETLANKSGLIIQSQTWPDNTTLELVFSGNAPFYMYRELIRTFNYANTKNENPITGQRFVTFILADDQGAVSGPIIIRITVLERNDEPDVDLGGGAGVIDTVTFNDGDNVGVELVSHPHRLRIMLPDSAAISKITVELRYITRI